MGISRSQTLTWYQGFPKMMTERHEVETTSFALCHSEESRSLPASREGKQRKEPEERATLHTPQLLPQRPNVVSMSGSGKGWEKRDHLPLGGQASPTAGFLNSALLSDRPHDSLREECLAVSLASTRSMPEATPLVTIKNVSKHCQMFPGRQNRPQLRTTTLVSTNH